MAREKDGFRDMVERIKNVYPDKEMLGIKEVASFIGCDPRTAKKEFSFNKFNKISVVTLAREMC